MVFAINFLDNHFKIHILTLFQEVDCVRDFGCYKNIIISNTFALSPESNFIQLVLTSMSSRLKLDLHIQIG